MTIRSWLAFPLSAAALLGACGDSSSGAKPDAMVMIDATPDAPPFVEAPHGNVPQVIKLAGPVISTPKVVPIFFMGDSAMQTNVEGFLTALVPSSYWTAIASEYGVGTITVAPTIVSTDTPPTTDDALKAWIAGNLDGTHANWPAPDDNTIYTVFLPNGVSLSTPFGNSCTAFGGYHDEGTTATSTRFIYALMPRCEDTIDFISEVTSHELIEASTDPFPFTAGAYQQTDDEHLIWSFTPGAEVGDMCEYVAAAPQRLVGNYVVQRSWSNKSAMAGHDPCVPVMQTPYVSAAPVLPDDLTIDIGDGSGPHTTKGIQVATGASKTIEVDLFSDVESADWELKAIDAGQLSGSQAELSLALDKTSGHNGDKVHLTITRSKDGQNGGSEFVLSSRVNNHSVSLWWGYVAN